MKRIVYRAAFLWLAGWVLLGSSGCQRNQTPLTPLPVPATVSQVSVADSSANLYFLVGWRNDFEDILHKLLRNGTAIQRAWIPAYDSPCECATCVSAMVVEVEPGADTTLLQELGFVQDTAPWVINCGVSEFRFYDI